MSEQYRKCVKCGVTAAQDPSLTFHRFPYIGKEKPESLLRSRIWAESSFPGESCTDVDFLRKLYTSHKMLCNRHFAAESFISKTRLNKFSIPIGTETLLHKIRNEAGSSDQISPQPGPSCVQPECFQEYALVSPQPGPSYILQDEKCFQEYAAVSPQPEPSHASQDEKCSGEYVPFTVPVDLPPTPEVIQMQNSNETSEELPAVIKDVSESGKQIYKLRKKFILRPLGVKKLEELSSREQKLYNICRRSLQKICILKRKWKKQKKVNEINKLVHNDDVRKLFDNKISDSLVLLLQSQIQNCPRKPKGRRYNLQQQIFALTLYKKSPACYKLLRRMFALPCQSTLKKLLNKVPLNW